MGYHPRHEPEEEKTRLDLVPGAPITAPPRLILSRHVARCHGREGWLASLVFYPSDTDVDDDGNTRFSLPVSSSTGAAGGRIFPMPRVSLPHAQGNPASPGLYIFMLACTSRRCYSWAVVVHDAGFACPPLSPHTDRHSSRRING